MTRHSYRVRFPGGAGSELAGIVDRDDERPHAPVVVFSHCFTCNKDLKAIVRIARGLAESGLSVLRFDMSGLGGSGGEFNQSNFTTNVADLKSAIAFAWSELGPVRGLIGHSFGGAASLEVASHRDTDDSLRSLSSLVTLAAPSDTQHLATLLVRMDPRIESDGAGTVNIGGRTWDITRQMVDDFRSHDLTASIARINSATLILHSPVDETVHYDHAIRIQTLLNARPDSNAVASLMTLADADHLLVKSSRDLEYVTEIISAFIRRHADAS